MRKGLLGIWLALPLGAWAYHEGPGQDRMALDDVDRVVGEASSFVADEDWVAAVERYDRALELLPESAADAGLRIRLERDKARMMAAQLPAARADLQALVTELLADDDADPNLLDQARSALANSQYYVTWLMRLEGLQREQWEPEIEASRQSYRLLAERAAAAGNQAALARHEKDLEAAIRLARADLQDLQGLPLPSQ